MNKGFHRVARDLALLAPAALLSACKSVDVPKVPGVTPYRMVIQQGNYISQEMVGQLKPGMTKEQVRFVLGTPLVSDIFHADRWDYVFYRELPNGKREQRNLSIVFENDKLARIIGDLLPAPGAAPQAGGFESQRRNDAAPRSIGKAAGKPDEKPAAKPAADETAAAKPASESAAPAPDAASPAPAAQSAAPDAAKPAAAQNWGTTEDAQAAKDAAKPAAKAEEKPAAVPEEQKTAEDQPKEKGFFGRMLEKIGL